MNNDVIVFIFKLMPLLIGNKTIGFQHVQDNFVGIRDIQQAPSMY